jgi:capsular polysaccharide biosynthesis protein
MTLASKSITEAAELQVVGPPSTCLPTPPRFAFGPVPADVSSNYYGSMHLNADGVYCCPGAALSDGFVIDTDGALLFGGEINMHPYRFAAMTQMRQANLATAPRQLLPGFAVALFPPGDGHLIYGHWLVDFLPRLALLEAAGYDRAKLSYLVPRDIPKFAISLMKLLGIPDNQLVEYEPGDIFQPESLLVPTAMHNGVRFTPMLHESVALFRRELTRAGADIAAYKSPARVWLGRTGNNRQLLNRGPIEAIAVAAGFTIVRPEMMSLLQQFALCHAAREVIGEYGSAFHTTIFSARGTVVCGLRGSELHPGFIQSGIGEVLGQPTGYVFGKTTSDPGPHDFTICEQDFADCLKYVFGGHARSPHAVAAPALSPAVKSPRSWWRFWRRKEAVLF